MGKTLARTLAAAGHQVKVANSRGPNTIGAEVLETGARAVTAEEALTDIDVAILSIPPTSFDKIKGMVAMLPDEVVVIDTSNYYPHRDGKIDAMERGQVNAEWVRDQLSRPIVKAWNAIGEASFANKGRKKGEPGRIAIPVAGDLKDHRDLAIGLVDDTGFDGFDAGNLAASWRQQPGAPVYCTDLTYEEMGPALARAERDRLSMRRDVVIDTFKERSNDFAIQLDGEWIVKVNRAIYL
jgi:predicted dinucleotide-binding enzyme